MIYKRSDKEIFVIEACRYDKEWRGVIVIPIDKWIEFNKKNILALTKISGPRICNDIVENALSKIVTYRLQSFGLNWTRFLWDKQPYQVPEGNRFVCYEILAILLQEMHIIKKTYSYSNYWPGHFCWGKLDLEETYKYGKPILLK